MNQPKTRPALNVLTNGYLQHSRSSEEGIELPPGVYKPIVVTGGSVFYQPVLSTNDRPLEVNGDVSRLLAEMRAFLTTSGEQYRRFGFAHKRGYLLHGAPGCGKSCAVRLLEERFASEFSGVALLLNGGDAIPAVDDIRSRTPNRPILVVAEDIDKDTDEIEESLLEWLDGHVALNNFIFVATTNYLDRIPPRIRSRPSRIDRVIEIKMPDATARALYLTQIGVDAGSVEVLADKTAGLSLAALKEVVIGSLILGEDTDLVVARLRQLNAADVRQPTADNAVNAFSAYVGLQPNRFQG